MNIRDQIIQRFISRTPKSQAMTDRAKRVLPGGDTRSGVYYLPYPAYMSFGSGSQLTDIDGNVYLDLLANYTSLVHGHAHPQILAAAQAVLPSGGVFASPMQKQIELAELICARVPSVENMRFTTSGSEGTQMALRAARAYTGRSGILKMHGSYHGSHDLAAATADPDADRGIAEGLRRNLFFVPYNDLPATDAMLTAHGHEIAALIVEPVPNAGGLPLAKPGYLQGLRDLCNKHQVLLVFDEVVTLRLHEGGYQAYTGVIPDLTAMGKIIGGGFAVGAFGGKREIMQNFDPTRKHSIGHSGTFNGHSVTMAAGLVSMQLLSQAEIDRINALGERLGKGFDEAFAEAGIVGRTTYAGSLVQVHWRSGDINNMGDVAAGFAQAGDLPYLLHLELMNRGVYSAARGEYCTTTAMNEADVDRAISIFSETLHTLKPYVAQVNEALIV
jgi:glutamate-1-semialdehyde 2,1-aminomutase